MDWTTERARHGGVDEIPLPGPGRMWLAGKHFVGPDPEAALNAVGATTVVCLTERHELSGRYDEYVSWLEADRPDRSLWWSIPDLHAPPVDEVVLFLDDLEARLVRGEGLLLHCGAGIGRAGTIAAALVVRAGSTLQEALDHVAAHRPMAGPEAGAQRDLLETLAGLGSPH